MATKVPPAYLKAVANVYGRDWLELRDDWMDPAGRLSFAKVGQKPEYPAYEVVGLEAAIAAVKAPERVAFSSLSPALLHQGIYLLHKAANVLVAAQDQVHDGLPTWSLSTSYQGALFAADAVINLLGVLPLNFNRSHFIVDTYSGPIAGVGKAKQPLAFTEINVIPFPDSISHFHHWAIFQRLLRSTKKLPFKDDVIAALVALDDREFASQRNGLHYSHTWQFEDLHDYFVETSILSFGEKKDLLTQLSPESPGFSIALGAAVFGLGLKLLSDLAEKSVLIQGEFELISQASASPRMKMRTDFERVTGWKTAFYDAKAAGA